MNTRACLPSLAAVSLALFTATLSPAAAQRNEKTLIEDLVAANHILVDQAVLDAYGHVSGRNPANPQHFFMGRNLAPALVTAADIVEYNPRCDVSNLTATVAAKLLKEIAGMMMRNSMSDN